MRSYRVICGSSIFTSRFLLVFGSQLEFVLWWCGMNLTLIYLLMFWTCLLRRANGDPTIFFCDWHVTHRRIQKLFYFISWANFGANKFGRRLLIIHPTMVFGPKFQYFFQLNEMRVEAKTWWLVSGPDVASFYSF